MGCNEKPENKSTLTLTTLKSHHQRFESMLTRSKAKAALAAEDVTVVVTPSATRQGIHKRWIYHDSPVTPSRPSRTFQSEEISPSPYYFETSSQAGSWSSSSSLSTLSDSSLSSLSDASFHATPSHFPPPSTPPPLTPRKLERSPLNHRWVKEGTSWRLTLVHDSFTPEDAIMRESMIMRQTDQIYGQQFAALMASRERARRALGLDLDIESDEMDDSNDEENRRVFIREETEPLAEDLNVGPSSQSRQRLGPHGTELLDDHGRDSFTPIRELELPVYPDAWIARRKMGRWQPTEEYIN